MPSEAAEISSQDFRALFVWPFPKIRRHIQNHPVVHNDLNARGKAGGFAD